MIEHVGKNLLWTHSDGLRVTAAFFLNDESSFHLCGMVNRHSHRILCYENPDVPCSYKRDNPNFLRVVRPFSPRREEIRLHRRVHCE
jgi:hypothetical protein